MGLARRPLERPHPVGRLRRRRRRSALGGGERGARRSTGATAQADGREHPGAAPPLGSKDDEPFTGEFTTFSDVTLEPKPLQSPCPIWLATNAQRLSRGQADSGGSELALTRVGKIADGWMTHSVSPQGFRRSW